MKTITIETKLDKKFLDREDVKKFIGKKVKVILTDVEEEKIDRKDLLESAGRWDLGGKLDNINIRDFAHE